jgi:hypothetical protein
MTCFYLHKYSWLMALEINHSETIHVIILDDKHC